MRDFHRGRDVATPEEWRAWAEAQQPKPRWYNLTPAEYDRLAAPWDAEANDAWLPVGSIPRPRTRLGWFVYHLVHGLWMRYPLHKVLGYAFANTKPVVFIIDELRLD